MKPFKCPHCEKIDHNDRLETACSNAEIYGSNGFTLACSHCKKLYTFYLRRVVIRDQEVNKASKEAYPSFG